MATWINKWNSWLADKPTLPGVWQRRDGGWFVRGSTIDPKTGKEREVRKTLPDCPSAAAARVELDVRLDAIRNGRDIVPKQKPRFSDYAVSLFERKCAVITRRSGIKSAATKRNWKDGLRAYLVPRFGEYYIDRILKRDIDSWIADMAVFVSKGKLSPRTVNVRISLMRTIMRHAVNEFELAHDPFAGVELLDDRTRPVYTRERSNSLTAFEVNALLESAKEHFPRHYALLVLGFSTGLRPSSLRPLRYRGPEKDLDLETGELQIRRSHSVGKSTMACTKQGTQYTISLPIVIADVLRWHISNIPHWWGDQHDLLFQGRDGFAHYTSLCRQFTDIAKKAGIKKQVTPRCMRRTFQDLARAASVHDFVTRSISGHTDDNMQRHYSTIAGDEQREGLAKIISLAGVRADGPRMHTRMHATGGADESQNHAEKTAASIGK